MTAPLTPRERVEASVRRGNLSYVLPSQVVTVHAGAFVDADVALELAAELEEANRRAEAAERQARTAVREKEIRRALKSQQHGDVLNFE